MPDSSEESCLAKAVSMVKQASVIDKKLDELATADLGSCEERSALGDAALVAGNTEPDESFDQVVLETRGMLGRQSENDELA